MSNSVTSKAVAKVAAVATGLALATSMLSLAPMAHAAALTDAQVSSILSLLTSFGADASTIANVKASLTGGTPSVPSTPSTGGSSCSFTRDLTVGSTGSDVTCLQNALKAGGYMTANATGYFGPATRAAVIAWQNAAKVTPAAGYFGAKSRAAFGLSGGSTPTTPTTPVTGNGLKVALASDSPNGAALVAAQAIGELAKFTFANPTSSAIRVTNLSFKRIGSSADSTLTNVYLYQGANRLTDAAGISNTAFNYNDAAGLFTVPAGGTVTISVRSDILTGTSGQQVGVQLVSVASNGTLDSSVSFPINGGIQTISSASIGSVAITYTGPSGATENPGTEVRVFEGSTVVSTHAARLESVTFENRGSTDDNDLKNIRLYVDGVQVGSSIAQFTDGRATFDLTASPLRLETGTRIIKVMADVVGGSGETYDVEIRRAADARFVDVELNQPILITGTWSGSANTVAAATLSVVKATNSPTSNVSVGATNVKWAAFEFRAAGEDVKIEAITFDVDQNAAAGMDNGKVFVNGVQVGSTKDIDAGGTEVTFGSSFIAKQGVVTVVELYGDAKTTAGTDYANATTVDVGVSVAAADTEGMDSGDSVTAISEVEGNSITMSSSSATLTKYSGYGNQTIVAGTNNARLGSFTLSAGSTEGVNVNTITVTLSSNESGTVTDLMLKDNATGAQIGTTKASPSTSNSFSVNVTLPSSGTKTIDIYGNVKSGANAGTWAANVDGSGTGAVTATSVTFGSSSASTGTLQTITIGSGTLSAAVAAANPVNANVLAGASSLKAGSFTFSAANSAYTVQEVKVKVPNGAATSITAVTLKYKNSAGVMQSVESALSVPATTETYATATFTGLSFYVPQNDSADLDVYVGVPSTSASALSGQGISVVLDADEGFKAIDSAGSQDTSLASSDLNSAATSGYGTAYVKKTVPTLALATTGYTSDSVSSGTGLYRFTVTADAAGTVEFKKVSFTVATSGVIGATWTLYDMTGGANTAVNTTGVEANASNVVAIYAGAQQNDTVQSIAAGQTKTYELRAATITGWGDAGDSITINFTEDSSAVVTQSSQNLTAQNMIWSDRSATSHTTITADWTNGYLVKDVTSDTRTCQFGTATTCNVN